MVMEMEIKDSPKQVIGKLDRLVLNNLNFELSKEGSHDGTVNIQTNIEVGVSTEKNAYYVAITVNVKAVTKEDEQPIFGALGKMTGFYSLSGPFEGTDEQLTNAAITRASIQIYPLLRRQIIEVLQSGGVGVKQFKFEPDFLNPPTADVSSTQQPAASNKAQKQRTSRKAKAKATDKAHG